jgi:hypothetical protein
VSRPLSYIPAPKEGPKVLVFDIETAPMLGYVWGLWENNVALNQIHTDWFILSWSAKWLGDPAHKIMYADQRNAKNVEDDRGVLASIWKLLDEADIVITQNGKAFDQKKLNARFIMQGFQPPSSFKHIDVMLIAKRHFAFTSNRLEYMTDKLCKKYKKLKPIKFQGFEMWKACLAGNREAWDEMQKYNKHDVLALEELYQKLTPWDSTVNFNLYRDNTTEQCKCGGAEFVKNGYCYSSIGKYQRYKCKQCGAEARDRENLFSPEKKKSLKAKVA